MLSSMGSSFVRRHGRDASIDVRSGHHNGDAYDFDGISYCCMICQRGATETLRDTSP